MSNCNHFATELQIIKSHSLKTIKLTHKNKYILLIVSNHFEPFNSCVFSPCFVYKKKIVSKI
jgi:hypothetical protein